MILKDYSYKDLLDTTIIIGEADYNLWGYPINFYHINKSRLVLETLDFYILKIYLHMMNQKGYLY